MSLPVIIGIDYDENAFYASGKSSADTYTGVYLFGSEREKRVFCTGDPVVDFRSAREAAYTESDKVYLSSTFDFFTIHSNGVYREAIGADGYRTIARVENVAV